MTNDTLQNTMQSGLRPVHMGLFPVLETLEACVDMGISQLPITTSTQLIGILMTYHNTMIKLMEETKNEKAP